VDPPRAFEPGCNAAGCILMGAYTRRWLTAGRLAGLAVLLAAVAPVVAGPTLYTYLCLGQLRHFA
jgi:hypothetical protein